jgi:hypothetical protein
MRGCRIKPGRAVEPGGVGFGKRLGPLLKALSHPEGALPYPWMFHPIGCRRTRF